jgi:FkbM family methyltransferase
MNSITTFFSFKLKFFKSLIRQFFLKFFFGPNVKALLTTTVFGDMLISPSDLHVSRQILKSGNYNPDEIIHLKKLVNKKDRLLVVGAHIGSFVIPASRLVYDVVAIEANPNNFKLLTMNIALNKLENINTYNFAAAEKKGTIDFLMSTENSGGSKRRPRIKKNAYYYDNPKTIKIEAFALDQKLNKRFDVVMMDIEGSEYFAIQGMQRIIRNARIFIFEFIPDHLENVAHVSVKKFVSQIPLTHLKKAYFPRLNIRVDIDLLEITLDKIVKLKTYEDGVILY